MLEPCQLPARALDYQQNVVELFSEDRSLSPHRLDDLMVRLYWLLLRKSTTVHHT